jgi:DNA-binding LacI/PurR family transcriptional regulator
MLPKFLPNLFGSLGKYGCFMTSDSKQIKAASSVIVMDADAELSNPHCLALCQSDDKRSVILDSDKGAYVALTYLENAGHTAIAYIGTNRGFAFENAVYDSFCAVNSFLDVELINLSGSDEKSGFDGFAELFRRHGNKFTAVCTVNDEVAKGVIKAASYYKVKVPEQLSVISLCSSNKKSSVDSILYDTDLLADEIFESLAACKRVSTVLFGGNLSVKGTCSSTKALTEGEKSMSDFLL